MSRMIEKGRPPRTARLKKVSTSNSSETRDEWQRPVHQDVPRYINSLKMRLRKSRHRGRLEMVSVYRERLARLNGRGR